MGELTEKKRLAIVADDETHFELANASWPMRLWKRGCCRWGLSSMTRRAAVTRGPARRAAAGPSMSNSGLTSKTVARLHAATTQLECHAGGTL